MTATELKSIIDANGGPTNLLGFGFDNSGGVTFQPGQFSYANNINDSLNVLYLTNFDSHGKPYKVIKPIDTIQSIMMGNGTLTNDVYDMISIRG